MIISLGIDADTTVEVAAEDDEEAVATKLSELPAINSIARQVGETSGFAAFETENDMDQSVARELALAYAGNGDGEGGFSDLFVERGWDVDGDSYFRQAGVQDELEKKLAPAVDAIVEEFPDLDGDTVMSGLTEMLREECVQAMHDSDTSKPADAIPSHVTIELPFVPDGHLFAIDDMFTSHHDVVFSAETAIPDSNLIRVLKFFNISPREFVDEAARRGIDLTSGKADEGASDYRRRQAEENALRWRAVLDIGSGSTENISRLPLNGKHEIAEWNRTVEMARTAKDHDRPASLSMDGLFTVLDNASYGGVAVYVCRVPLKEFVSGKYDRPFLATGGFVGVHDFINGSGYIETPDAPVLIDPSKGSYRISPGKDAVDDVYGIVGSYYRAETSPAEIPEWQRIEPGKWLRTADDGRMAAITLSTARDGTLEYWVSTTDEHGAEAGPRETSEVFLTLEDAKGDGDRSLEAAWTPGRQP